MTDLGTDESLIVDYLKQYPGSYVSAGEVCKRAAGRKRFGQDREWARPVLRRMSIDGWLDANEYGQYKLCDEALGSKKCSKSDRLERARSAITEHVLKMSSSDDTKLFTTLVREAVQTEYSEETSWLRKKD